jgi:pyrimidine operon attenuation protein/uracil phosphoribosyltransferase
MLKVQVPMPSADPGIRVHQELHREAGVRNGLAWLEKSGAIMHGHFRFGKGRDERHGQIYIHGRRLFNKPFASKWLAQALVQILPRKFNSLEEGDQDKRVEIVAGPQTAGIILARDLAEFLSTARKVGQPDVEAMFLDKDGDGGYRIHNSDMPRLVDSSQSPVRPRRILLVDDVRHRGATLAACYGEISAAEGEVVATAQLIDRGLRTLPIGLPNFYVGQTDPQELYEPRNCPMCAEDKPFTMF